MNNTPDTQGAADDALAERFKLMRQADSALLPAFPTQEQLETQQPVAVASAFSGAQGNEILKLKRLYGNLLIEPLAPAP